jgi:hypothetical protein
MKLRSIRAQITLWNVGAFAIILVLLGVVLWMSLRSTFYFLMDHDMARRAEIYANTWSPMGTQRMSTAIPPAGPGDLPVNMPPPNPGKYPDKFPPWMRDMPPFPEFRILYLKEMDHLPVGGGFPLDAKSFKQSAGGASVFSEGPVHEMKMRIYSRPLTIGSGIAAVLQVAQPETPMETSLTGLAQLLIILFPFGLGLAALAGIVITRKSMELVTKMVAAANTIEADNLSERLPVVGHDAWAIGPIFFPAASIYLRRIPRA